MEAHKEITVAEVPHPTPIRWGALFGGLVLIFASGWLFTLLGSALGFSIADATDMEAMGQGLGIGAILWLAVSWLAAFFLGGMLAARLAGTGDQSLGMLHGVTLWALATVFSLVLGWFGLRTVFATGQAIVSTTADVTQAVIPGNGGNGGGNGAQAGHGGGLGGTIAAAMSSDLTRTIRDALQREASRAMSESAGRGVTTGEVSRAMEQIDSSTLQEAAGHLVTGDTQQAKQVLARGTSLSQREVDQIVDGVSERVGDQWSELGQTELVRTIESTLQDQIDTALSAVADAAGPRVTAAELRTAVDQLDAETLAAAGQELVTGNAQGAKDVLARNTTLSEPEVAAIVDGIAEEFDQEIRQLRQDIDAAVETASDYTQGVLWAAFVGAALGLVACLGGGALGASTVDRLYAVHARTTRTTPTLPPPATP